jgi:hypothetical protein
MDRRDASRQCYDQGPSRSPLAPEAAKEKRKGKERGAMRHRSPQPSNDWAKENRKTCRLRPIHGTADEHVAGFQEYMPWDCF